jgi:hypothetical protein
VKAQLTVFALLGQASGFFHGSQTNLGKINDLRINDLLSYLSYQMMVVNLPPFDDSIVHHLSDNERCVKYIHRPT